MRFKASELVYVPSETPGETLLSMRDTMLHLEVKQGQQILVNTVEKHVTLPQETYLPSWNLRVAYSR